jgi:hypothetical protein
VLNRRITPLLILGIAMFLIGLACNAVTGNLPANTPPPSQISRPTLPPEPAAILPSSMPKPTTPPSVTDRGPAASSGLQLSDSLYTGSDGIFEFYPPEDWDITAEDVASIWIEAPDYSGAIFLEATNTIYKLDGVSFERFVDAREATDFAFFDNYFVLNSVIDQENGIAVVEKSLDYDGIPQNVVSYYYQDGLAILANDYWADDDRLDEYNGAYDEFFNSLTTDTTMVDDVEPYLWIYEFFGPNDLFFMEVPVSWRHEETTGNATAVDTFFSPDEHAVIQNITYDKGQPISKSEAGKFALGLLTTYYADDIKISDDQVQQDGSERLTWNSPGGDFSGISSFESRGNTFLLFTTMWDLDYEDMYFPILDYTLSTYDVQ